MRASAFVSGLLVRGAEGAGARELIRTHAPYPVLLPHDRLALLPWKPCDPVAASDATNPDLAVDFDRHGPHFEELIAVVRVDFHNGEW